MYVVFNASIAYVLIQVLCNCVSWVNGVMDKDSATWTIHNIHKLLVEKGSATSFMRKYVNIKFNPLISMNPNKKLATWRTKA